MLRCRGRRRCPIVYVCLTSYIFMREVFYCACSYLYGARRHVYGCPASIFMQLSYNSLCVMPCIVHVHAQLLMIPICFLLTSRWLACFDTALQVARDLCVLCGSCLAGGRRTSKSSLQACPRWFCSPPYPSTWLSLWWVGGLCSSGVCELRTHMSSLTIECIINLQ